MPSRRRARAALPLTALAVGTLLAACGNDESPAAKAPHQGTATASEQGGVQVVTLTTGSDYRFHPSTIVVHPGRVKVVLKNTEKSGAPHNFAVTGFPGDYTAAAYAGATVSNTFTAPSPGTYQFVCTFHVQQGQVGKLVVRG